MIVGRVIVGHDAVLQVTLLVFTGILNELQQILDLFRASESFNLLDIDCDLIALRLAGPFLLGLGFFGVDNGSCLMSCGNDGAGLDD